MSGENRGPAPLVERVVLAALRRAVGIKMGFHGHSNALDIDPMISARAAHALRVDMTGVAVARCTGQSTPARDPNMPDAPTFGRYAEIPYDRMTPEQQDGYRALIEARGALGGAAKLRAAGPFYRSAFSKALSAAGTERSISFAPAIRLHHTSASLGPLGPN